jgi:hypothetical protein
MATTARVVLIRRFAARNDFICAIICNQFILLSNFWLAVQGSVKAL